jgi:hypothetical protein
MSEPIIIHNISGYTIQIIDNNLILNKIDNRSNVAEKLNSTQKITSITEDELTKLCVSKSTIKECIVKNNEKIITNKTLYSSIMKDIWKEMHKTHTFNINQSTYKFEDTKKGKNQLYFREIDKYYWGKIANETLKEILNMIKISQYTIELSIILENKDTIYYTNIKSPDNNNGSKA